MKTITKSTTDMRTKIALKHEGAIIVPNYDTPDLFESDSAAASFSAAIMQLGFVPSEELTRRLRTLTVTEITDLYNTVLPELNRLKGADVVYTPMYPNFPQQVLEASEAELFFNAMVHYTTFGQWIPEYDKLPRSVRFENAKFQTIKVIDDAEFQHIFAKLAGANESLSASDKDAIAWFIENKLDYYTDEKGDIPFKETLCFIAALKIERGEDIHSIIQTTTDVLRIATALSGGDISLAENTKFKSLPKKTRRMLCNVLESVITEEDVNRHYNKWIRLFHNLHVGDFSTYLYNIAKKFRNGETIHTFNSRVEALIKAKKPFAAATILSERPGIFARKLDHLLRMSPKVAENTANLFLSVADKVDTRVLMQLLGHMKTRGTDVEKRVVFPKGNTARATVVRTPLKALDNTLQINLVAGIKDKLVERFVSKDSLGKVWIDPALKNCPIPTGQRSASEGLRQIARGSRIPFGDAAQNTLRFFIYWVGQDIDLSATMHDEDFGHMGQVSYTNLRYNDGMGNYTAIHSGDIVEASNGAVEFIDINIQRLLNDGVRYIAMNVYVYSGPTFEEHKKVYAGWMTRSEPGSNEIFDAKTVEQKIDLASKTKNSIPVVFDLKTREAIWADLSFSGNQGLAGFNNWDGDIVSYGNNVESNRASIRETLEAITNMQNKPTLFDLFTLHTVARGRFVQTKEEADTVFSLDEGTTPYDITEIQSQYLT